LPVDLHDTLSDIIARACHLDSLLPFLIQHSKEAFPHLECLDDLKKKPTDNLRLLANW
jgi:ATP-dependent RNA helicase SUPV3L1/SUV3